MNPPIARSAGSCSWSATESDTPSWSSTVNTYSSRVSRLATGRARSHIRPDLYLFAGASVQAIWGAGVVPMQVQPVTANDVIAASNGDAPRFVYGTLMLGLDLRLGRRVGFAGFIETYPSLNNSQNVGTWWRPLGIPFHALGVEVSFCF